MTIYRCPVQIDFDGAGSPAFNIFHLRVADSVTSDQPDIDAALTALKDWYTALKPVLAPGTVVRVPFDLVNITNEPPTSATFTASSITGSGTTEAPQMLSMCVSWKTQVRTRSGRGRTFIGPLAATTMDSGDGTPTTTARNTVVAATNALVASSIAPNAWALGVYSRTEGLIRDVTAWSHTDQFAIMRSRR